MNHSTPPGHHNHFKSLALPGYSLPNAEASVLYIFLLGLLPSGTVPGEELPGHFL